MAQTVYDVVGGEPFFVDLVNDFYDRVSQDQILMAVYPKDLTESRRTTAGFLAQYWGGPPNYSAERGHPRLRMRHSPFAIGQTERDAWLGYMLGAVDRALVAWAAAVDGDADEIEGVRQVLLDAMTQYFETGSTAMINS